jgi:Ca2+-binding EF-hand superfamily protein
MGLGVSIPLTSAEKAEIRKETGFSNQHITRLHRRFSSLDKKNTGRLCRDDFATITKLAMNPVRDRVIHAFFIHKDTGEILDTIDFRQFIRTLAIFRPAVENITPSTEPNSRLAKMTLSFKLLDSDRDGKISRQELITVLKSMVRIGVTDEQIAHIADRAIDEADVDGDGCIDFDEFVKANEKVVVEEILSLRFMLV